MSVKRYDFDCYAFYDSARLNVQECDDGDYVLHSDYAALRSSVARLEEALKKIVDGCGTIPDSSTIFMNGKVPEIPKYFNKYDMQEIARRALRES